MGFCLLMCDSDSLLSDLHLLPLKLNHLSAIFLNSITPCFPDPKGLRAHFRIQQNKVPRWWERLCERSGIYLYSCDLLSTPLCVILLCNVHLHVFGELNDCKTQLNYQTSWWWHCWCQLWFERIHGNFIIWLVGYSYADTATGWNQHVPSLL